MRREGLDRDDLTCQVVTGFDDTSHATLSDDTFDNVVVTNAIAGLQLCCLLRAAVWTELFICSDGFLTLVTSKHIAHRSPGYASLVGRKAFRNRRSKITPQ